MSSTTSLGNTLTEPNAARSGANGGSLSLLNAPNVSSSLCSSQESVNSNASRKRRAARKLTRIAIGKLSSSNESLNSNASSSAGGGGGGANGGSANNHNDFSGSDDDSCGPSSFAGVATSEEQWSDQKRFCAGASSSASSSATLIAASQPDHARHTERTTSTSSTASSSASDLDEVAIVECQKEGAGSTSGAKSVSQVASSGLLIAGGQYEIVGDGKECKAVDMQTKTIFHCLIMKPEEYKTFLTVLERLKSAESMYNDKEEYSILSDLLIPIGTKPVLGDNGNWYVLLPDHQGNLHSLVCSSTAGSTNESTPPTAGGGGGGGNGNVSPLQPKVFSERRIQPIFKQIVALVDFCHRIGIYFRDFRLRKFVFVDKERTQIRLNNVLDLWVAPQIDDDQIGQRFKSQVCPVYVAPEILSTGVYAGQPADMWALGILMFSLLMGRFPFHDPNPSALFKRIKARRFSCPVNDGISHNARWLLYGLLRQNPADRPTAEEILQSHWLRVAPECLPDGLATQPPPTKSMGSHGALSMNSQSVFSNSILMSQQQQQQQQIPAPPAFVRVSGGGGGVQPPAQQQPLTNLPLQQVGLPLASAPVGAPSIHVRLALISNNNSSVIAARNSSSGAGGSLPSQLQREAPTSYLSLEAQGVDEPLDQLVPELSSSSPATQAGQSSSSQLAPPTALEGLSISVSDHYYVRPQHATNSSATVLSLQSFPPTGMSGAGSAAAAHAVASSRIAVAAGGAGHSRA